uniref:Uncharacterized protein n=1 Tax=Solanum tuberosum TaxID=4113 RepID=M1DDR9_SOLTU
MKKKFRRLKFDVGCASRGRFPDLRISIPHRGANTEFSQDEGSLGDQQWFLSAGHVQGVGSGRDTSCTDPPTPYEELRNGFAKKSS